MRFAFHSLALSLNFLNFKMEITILNHEGLYGGPRRNYNFSELIFDTTKVI